jgi:hypothetical protein
VEALLHRYLRMTEETNPWTIYVSPELVKDIKDCKYGLGWDCSFETCHRSLFRLGHARTSKSNAFDGSGLTLHHRLPSKM